ncbi:MAG: phosphate signaling complex protein PhoU [Rhodospirillaceae bacterium]|jgi:phosphate transport system protein|uniref:Phosphate-specific transport system accessory protein PhoU n=1 Tax=Methylophilales bacterium HTCC2181 TaxID=383631 RepID=A0P4Q6_9PROT|nr:phosphate uptake regulator PhoU [Methylophilales bacterium HTCC2181]MBT5429506.1 phosphate signaling complex protein PhoU [Rhodospirillaceae bacterium]MDC0128732.1 phosphate signaling complex protein PhoU [Methylophilaceae bacterium]|tara:strand:- start:6 stop:710 length:705 start_codon:yes stop_codon:yes gene_type:complete
MASEHIYKQYDADLQSIRAKVLEMGTIVEEQLSEAVQSLVDADTKLAEKVIRRDEEVNDLEIDIDEDCSLLIGKRSPVAADLRNVLMMIKIIGDLERIGDESTKIANATIRIIENDIMSKPQFKNINSMLSSVQLMLRQALNSFARLDTTETIEVLEKDKEVDEEYRSHMRQLLTYMLEDPRTISMSLELMFVTKSLERIGDHAKNITQSVIYTVKGTDVRHSSIKEIKAELKH